MAQYHKYKTSKHGTHHSYRVTNSGTIDRRHFTQANNIAEGNRLLGKFLRYTFLVVLGLVLIIGLILFIIYQVKEFLN